MQLTGRIVDTEHLLVDSATRSYVGKCASYSIATDSGTQIHITKEWTVTVMCESYIGNCNNIFVSISDLLPCNKLS